MAEMKAIQRTFRVWMRFWFSRPPYLALELMRIGTGLMVLYVFVLHMVDLEVHYSDAGWALMDSVRQAGSLVLPFSPLHWVEGAAWPYLVSIVGLLAGTAFVLGVYPFFSGMLCLLVNLGFVHGNPAVVLGIDGLLTLALFYLSLSPCARNLTVMALRSQPEALPVIRRPDQEALEFWGGIPLRMLQIHLCLLYFLSALSRLNPDWLSGAMLMGPRTLTLDTFTAETAAGAPPLWAASLAIAVVLFELYYTVFIWNPRFRYLVLALAVVLHLGMGIGWDLLPFNVLMLLLNLAFVKPHHGERLLEILAGLLGTGWQPENAKKRKIAVGSKAGIDRP